MAALISARQQGLLLRGSSTRKPHVNRGVVTRAVETETATEEVKIASTLSALDAMLPAPAAATPSTSAAAASNNTAAASSSTTTTSPAPWAASSRAAPPAGAAAARQAKDRFEEVMAFDGLAPETINGRAAMIGILAAIAGETHGESLFSQLVSGGAGAALAVFALVTLASLAPAARGLPLDQVLNRPKKAGRDAPQPREFGPFGVTAETINGRAAMLGFLALMLIEGASSQPFFY